MSVEIGVEGLKELRRDLRKIDPELELERRQRFRAIGERLADEIRSKIDSVSGDAAASIRAGVSGNNAYIAGGKRSVPYFGWLDFGSRNPNVGAPRSVGPWAHSGRGPDRGRYFLPVIDRNRDRIADEALDAMNAAIQKAGL